MRCDRCADGRTIFLSFIRWIEWRHHFASIELLRNRTECDSESYRRGGYRCSNMRLYSDGHVDQLVIHEVELVVVYQQAARWLTLLSTCCPPVSRLAIGHAK